MPGKTIAQRLEETKKNGKDILADLPDLRKESDDLNKQKDEVDAHRRQEPQENDPNYEAKKAEYDEWRNELSEKSHALHTKNYEIEQKEKQLKDSIVDTQALLSLRDKLGGADHVITDEELIKARENEGFTRKLISAEALNDTPTDKDFNIMLSDPEALHEFVRNNKDNIPQVDTFNYLVQTEMLFGRKNPVPHENPDEVNNYRAKSSAIDSIALLSIVNKHKDEPDYKIEDIFSPENLAERQEAYDEAWKRIQAGDHTWIAEQIYNGSVAGTKLCDKTVQSLGNDILSDDVLNKPEYLMTLKLQHVMFDADQEWQRACPTEMLQAINKDLAENNKPTLPVSDDPENAAAENKRQAQAHTNANISFDLAALYSSVSELHNNAAQIMFKKEFDKDPVDLTKRCALSATAMEMIHEGNQRLFLNGSFLNVAKSPAGMTDEQIHEKAGALGFTDAVFNDMRLSDDAGLKTACNADARYRDLKTQIENLDTQIQADPDNQELQDRQTALKNDQNARLRQLAERQYLTERFPELPIGGINNAKNLLYYQIDQNLAPVREDPTGTIANNMVGDILSGEFSRKNGGHTNLDIENNMPSLKNPMSRGEIMYNYAPDELKKEPWEDKKINDYLKFTYTAQVAAGDLQDPVQHEKISNYCGNHVLAGRANGMLENEEADMGAGPAAEENADQKLLENFGHYKGITTQGASKVIVGDGRRPVIMSQEINKFDNAPEKMNTAYERVKEALRQDIRRDPDNRLNRIRESSIELMETDSMDYGKAIFHNHHLEKLATSGAATLNINIPSQKLKQELGKDTFNKLADVRLNANNEILMGIKTEQLLASKPAEDQPDDVKKRYKKEEAKHLSNLLAQHNKTLQAFDGLCGLKRDHLMTDDGTKTRLTHNDEEMEKTGPGANADSKPRMISNDLRETQENNRGPRLAMGWINGEKKAIENGWGLEELSLLGMIGQLEVTSQGDLPETLPQNEESRRQQKEFHDALMELKNDVWYKPAYNNDAKKEAADKIRQFIETHKEENDLTKALFSELPTAKINSSLSAVSQLRPQAARQLGENPDPNAVNQHLTGRLNSTLTTGVPFLNALTEVSGNPQARDNYLQGLYNKEGGPNHIKKTARVLAETVDELRKNINAQVDQLSQEMLADPDKVADPDCRKYIGSAGLRKQLAFNQIKGSEMVKQYNALSKLQTELLQSKNFTPEMHKDIFTESFNVRKSHISDRSYHLSKKIPFTSALDDTGKLDPVKLYNEQAKQAEHIKMYKHNLDVISDHARENLIRLQETLNDQKDMTGRSGEFVRMYNAVKAVSELDGTKTPEEIEQALNEMVTSSREYVQKNDASFKSIKGGKRLDAAREVFRAGAAAKSSMIGRAQVDPQTKKQTGGFAVESIFFDKNKSLSENIRSVSATRDAIATNPAVMEQIIERLNRQAQQNPQAGNQQGRNNNQQGRNGRVPGRP